MKTILMYQWFDCQESQRAAELKSCVEHNLSIEFDETIIHNDSTEPAFFRPRVRNLSTNRRITYRDYLEVVTHADNEGALVVLTNTDIKLATDFLRIADIIRLKEFLCFSRYESNTGALAEAPWCTQDTWAMIGQPIHRSVLYQSDIPLGMPGCEIRFAEMMWNVGFSVFNPCLDIKNIHVHSHQAAHKDENRIYGAYLSTPACNLQEMRQRLPKLAPTPCYLTKFIANRIFYFQ